MRIVFKNIPPPKKNAKRIFRAGSRTMILPSARHEAWHDEHMWLLKKVKNTFTTCRLEATFYPPNNRRFDASNSFESIADILVDAGILQDDSIFLLQDTHLKLGGVDKENPRVEVDIYDI